MATKSKKPKSNSKIAQVRRDYNAVKRSYHALGKAALGARKGSKVQKEYASAKRAYKTVGRMLGKLTGVR
jgi:hypothetical protein